MKDMMYVVTYRGFDLSPPKNLVDALRLHQKYRHIFQNISLRRVSA